MLPLPFAGAPSPLPSFSGVALLVLFGFVAGAATAVSPCVLPVLPVALAAGATGGRRRPLGVVVGLVGSFTFATVALVYVLSSLGLPDDFFRTLAIVVLGVAGLALIVPGAAARIEAWLSRIAPRAPVRVGGDGFGSGLLLGASLGLVYAPCAGPILAAVITVSASQEFTGDRLAVALAYSAGSGLVLYALMLGGRRLTSPLARRSLGFQRAMGAVMVVVAVLMAAELDIRFENEIAASLPALVVNPSKDLEEGGAARDRLADLRGGRGGTIAEAASASAAAERADGAKRLPVLGRAPALQDTQRWFNTRNGRPLSLRSLRGRVVLLDFWTYSCINCIRTLPALKAWDGRYRREGLTIIGLHAPEFPFERDAGNVERAIARNGLRYPVAQDNDFATWRAYGNQYWPAKYLIDARGRVRFVHFGEGEYDRTENAIRSLLAEAGHDRLGRHAHARVETAAGVATPESYLGAERAQRFLNGAIQSGTHDFELPPRAVEALPPHHLAYEGPWRIDPSHATAAGDGARLHLRFYASRVFLVLGAGERPGRVRVALDGRTRRTLTVTEHRLFELVRLPKSGDHLLTLTLGPGTEAYAFTFG
jgi:cytochrome c biogenesis protein CcdA/thiol-disulfide isomerase/thioredoxin